MIRRIAITVAAVIAVPVMGLLVYAAAQPDSFRIQRTASINALPDRISPLINDFRNWAAWSPYETKDPDMKRILSGAAAGEGAVYAWAGNDDVGTGRMEIAEASPSRVTIRLEFEKPFKASNVAEFIIQRSGEDTTNVTWAMYGPMPYVARIVQIFCDLDGMVGQDFEAGLARMKAVVEG
jgi:hypothetical protein